MIFSNANGLINLPKHLTNKDCLLDMKIIILYICVARPAFINNVLFYKNDPYRNCPPPFVLIGMQCLFFSQPYKPWGLLNTWDESYANYYDAVTICRSKTTQTDSIKWGTSQIRNIRGQGDLASDVVNYEEALKYCIDRVKNPGGCSPSLLYKKGKCRQWSPIDGSVVDIPCDWSTKMRFVCEFVRE